MDETPLPERLVVHLGAHKTASTHFNRLLKSNRRLRRRGGLRVAKKKPIRALITSQLLSDAKVDSLDPPAILRELGAGWRTLLVSDENIIGTPQGLFIQQQMYKTAGPKLARLQRIIAPVPDRLALLAIRNPVSFLASIYGEYIRRSGYISFEDFLDGTPLERICWADLVARVRAGLPDTPLVVWAFEDYHTLLPELVNRVLDQPLDTAPTYAPFTQVVRPGLSQRAVDEIKVLCAAHDGPVPQPQLEEIVARFPKSAEAPAPAPLDGAQRQMLETAYARDLDLIRDMDGVTLLGR